MAGQGARGVRREGKANPDNGLGGARKSPIAEVSKKSRLKVRDWQRVAPSQTQSNPVKPKFGAGTEVDREIGFPSPPRFSLPERGFSLSRTVVPKHAERRERRVPSRGLQRSLKRPVFELISGYSGLFQANSGGGSAIADCGLWIANWICGENRCKWLISRILMTENEENAGKCHWESGPSSRSRGTGCHFVPDKWEGLGGQRVWPALRLRVCVCVNAKPSRMRDRKRKEGPGWGQEKKGMRLRL